MNLDGNAGLAYPRKMVEQIIIGLSNPMNRQLIKLVAFEFSDETRQHFRRELRTWLRDIQTFRFKPDNRRGSSKFYFDLLYDYPFGGVEVQNMRILMDAVLDDYPNAKTTKSTEEMVDWLRQFHTELAARLHRGEDVLDLIPE
ncbi:MAG TPA: hypothetical protein VMF86_08440 [Stellaceae bacterium]|nr:hypothetical protein [Stellaceae bacterium]